MLCHIRPYVVIPETEFSSSHTRSYVRKNAYVNILERNTSGVNAYVSIVSHVSTALPDQVLGENSKHHVPPALPPCHTLT